MTPISTNPPHEELPEFEKSGGEKKARDREILLPDSHAPR